MASAAARRCARLIHGRFKTRVDVLLTMLAMPASVNVEIVRSDGGSASSKGSVTRSLARHGLRKIEPLAAAHDVTQVGVFTSPADAACVGKELPGQLGRAANGEVHLRAAFTRHGFREVAVDHHQEVVEVVRESSCEMSHHRHRRLTLRSDPPL